MLLAIVEMQKRCHLPPGDVVVASNSASLQAGSKSVELSPALRWKGHWRPMVFPFFFGNVKHHVTLVSSGHFRATYKWKRKKSGGGSSPPPLTPQKKNHPISRHSKYSLSSYLVIITIFQLWLLVNCSLLKSLSQKFKPTASDEELLCSCAVKRW